MTRTFSLLALFLVAAPLAAQTTAVLAVRVGVDANRVDGLADWQALDGVAFNEGGIPVAETDAFPSFLGVQVEAALQSRNRLRAGYHVGYGSTSGRLHYADYSGVARMDRRARRIQVGSSVEVGLTQVGAIGAWAGLQSHMSFVTVDVAREATVGERTLFETEGTYRGTLLSVEPGLTLEAAVGAMVLRAEAGWELSASAPLTGPPSVRGVDEEVSTTWGGYRIGLSGGIRL